MTTNAQLADMLQQTEKERRRERFVFGTSPAQRGTRIESRKGKGKGNRNNQKRHAIKEF